MARKDKPLAWLHGEVKTPPFGQAARIEAGYLLRELQRGTSLGMPHSRPMPAIGARCHELRGVAERETWRIIYRVDADAIVIVEVFAKKTTQTPQAVLEACRKRLKEYVMRPSKRRKLERKGWRFGTAREFLGLSEEEAAYVELRLRLADSLKNRRRRRHLTQAALARLIQSSQSRVAKMEGGDPSVSLDLLVRSLLALGASSRDLARTIAAASLH